MSEAVVVVRGAGDLGSGCALRLIRCGFRVLAVEQPRPTAIRRSVSFSEAVFGRVVKVEEVQGVLVYDRDSIEELCRVPDRLPVAVDPDLDLALSLSPDVIVDARLLKRNLDMSRHLAPGTVALGPGFTAGVDVDAVVETNRGPNLGRVLWQGSAQANTGSPAPVAGREQDRVLRAPHSGPMQAIHDIGDRVEAGDIIATVDSQPIRAPFRGMIRGLLPSGFTVDANMKIGDLDPRLDPDLCYHVSDKALAVAGGVLEATIMLLRRNGLEPTWIRHGARISEQTG